MLTYPGDTSATFHPHKRRANYRDPTSSKALETPARTPINEPEQASSKPHLIYKKMCANIALDYYNHKNGTRFELVEDDTLDSYAFVDSSESWIHCCFNAKDDSSINNFFAELQYFYPSGPSVTTCKILTPGETQVGCGNCKSVTHPIVGYRGGSLGNVTHASYAMSDDQEEYSPATTIGYPYPVTINPFVPEPPTFDLVPNLDLVAWVQKRRIRGEKFANRALDHYNKTNGTKFALVNDVSTKWSPFSETWIHISFNAIDSSVVKLFFAEIKYDKFSESAVTVCKILEGETQGGCKNCLCKPVTHPVVGYRGDFLFETEVDKKDNDACYKVYCEEFLGETTVG